jgi:hypothetical protein
VVNSHAGLQCPEMTFLCAVATIGTQVNRCSLSISVYVSSTILIHVKNVKYFDMCKKSVLFCHVNNMLGF